MEVTSLVVAFALGCVVAFLVSPGAASGPGATEQRVAELRAEEARRDRAEVDRLIALATGARERLNPVVDALVAGTSTPDTAVLDGEVARWAETRSAGNGVNVAFTALRSAVRQLAAAPGARDPRQAVLLAMDTWSAGALQLDVISIEAGLGHVHVHLSQVGPGH